MTLFSLLAEGTDALMRAGETDAERDAQQLLLSAFHLDMVHYLLNRMQELEDSPDNRAAAGHYGRMIEKRAGRIPLQQILGSQEFMGLEFHVNEHTLIPRQDTETLVELVLEEQKNVDFEVLDLCTGSGCIAVSLAVKGGYRKVTAVDLSAEALKVAEKNVQVHNCRDRVGLFEGDLFQALDGQRKEDRSFDIITSNPPYIPTAVINTLEPEVRDHEPRMALDGTADGLHFYRRIAVEAKPYLKENGVMYLEIGYDQGEAVSALLSENGYRQIRVCRDLAGNDRVVSAHR